MLHKVKAAAAQRALADGFQVWADLGEGVAINVKQTALSWDEIQAQAVCFFVVTDYLNPLPPEYRR